MSIYLCIFGKHRLFTCKRLETVKPQPNLYYFSPVHYYYYYLFVVCCLFGEIKINILRPLTRLRRYIGRVQEFVVDEHIRAIICTATQDNEQHAQTM